MARRAAAFILLLLILPAVSPNINSPHLVTAADIVVSENGTVSVGGGSLYDVDLNLSIPAQTSYQQVQTNEPPIYDYEGNAYLRIFSDHPSNPFTYSRTISVQASQRTTPSLPGSYSVPSGYSVYLRPTARTQSDSRLIREAAAGAAGNATTPFEKIARLAIYVNSIMSYDEKLIGKEEDALWALQNRRGVCMEYSTLFVALSRAAGIPARYVTGYVYSDRFSGWMGHAWAEAYAGVWVPVDPTWLEAGSLDALHVEAGKYAEISREPSLLATVSDASAKLTWDTSGKSGAHADNIVTRSTDSSPPLSSFEFSVVEPTLPMGGSTLAYLSMRGTDYRVISVSLAGCTGVQSVTVQNPDQYLILEPNRTSTAVWVISAATGLSEEYTYACPLLLNSPVLEERLAEVKVDPRLGKGQQYSATLQEKTLPPGSQNRVLFSLPEYRRASRYYAITDDGVFSRVLYGSADSIAFETSGQGGRRVYVAGEGGDYKILYYESDATPALSIDSFLVPPEAILARASRARARISAKNYPADFSLEFSFDNQSAQAGGRMDRPQDVEFVFYPEATGSQQASLRLSGAIAGSALDEKILLVRVSSPPAISVSDVSVSRDSTGLLSEIRFSYSGEPLSPSVEIGRNTYPIANLSLPLELRLQSGTYGARLYWSDLAGNNYTSGESIRVWVPDDSSPGNESGKKGSLPSPPSACALPLAIILAAAFASFRRS